MIKEQELVQVDDKNEHPDIRGSLQLVTGGKGGDSDNWLAGLNVNTIFLARAKGSKELFLNNYLLLRRSNTGDSTNLRWAHPDDRILDLWVPTLEFSRQFTLHEVIAQLPEQVYNEEKEDNSDGSDGSIRPERLPDDAGDQEGLPVHENTP
jgi:hypothetical protein